MDGSPPTDWYEALKDHPLVGRPDDALRAQSLEGVAPIPTLSKTFDRVSCDTTNVGTDWYNLQVLTSIQAIPMGMFASIHNGGALHILTNGDAEAVLGMPDSIRESGLYVHRHRAATSETSSGYIEGTISHEAGHALSYALGRGFPPDPVVQTLLPQIQEDISHMGPEDLEAIRGVDEGLAELLGRHVPGKRFKASQVAVYRTVYFFQDKGPALRTHLPRFTEALDVYAGYMRLSRHPAIVSAYTQDLHDLEAGKGPGGDRLGQIDGKACIFGPDGEAKLWAGHYVPSSLGGDGYADMNGDPDLGDPEEAFAEIVGNTISPKYPALKRYFPKLAREVEGVLGALDRLYDEARRPDLIGPEAHPGRSCWVMEHGETAVPPVYGP